jgi:hypothetical protein
VFPQISLLLQRRKPARSQKGHLLLILQLLKPVRNREVGLIFPFDLLGLLWTPLSLWEKGLHNRSIMASIHKNNSLDL